MQLIKISGQPYEMGVQYGEQGRKIIKKAVNLYYKMGAVSLTSGWKKKKLKILREVLPAYIFHKRKKEYLQTLAMNYEEFIEKNYPDALLKIKGIANGAKVAYEDILFMNTFPDIIKLCSSYTACGRASKSAHTYLGMNTDESEMTKDLQIILHEKSRDGKEILGVGLAGVICPVNGITNDGLAFQNHILITDQIEIKKETNPLFIAIDSIIHNSTDVETAFTNFKGLQSIECSTIFFFGDEHQVGRIENTSGQYDLEIFQDKAVGSCMRPLSKKIGPYDATEKVSKFFQYNAITRNNRMKELLELYYGSIDMEKMEKIASDHGEGETKGKSICQHSRFGVKTISTTIMKPKEKKVRIFYDNPCKRNYQDFQL